MATSLGKMLDDVTGRFWWVLVVSDSASAGLAHILRVMRGRGAGRSFVDFSFSGTLAECREFQVKNGGGADGILLVDCCTPVKIVSDEVGTVADFPGFKLENLDCVESISGDFSVVALKSAVENFVADIEKYGFRILRHVPSVLVVAELLDVPGDQPCLFTNCDDGFVRLLLSSGGKIVAGYKVAGENAERLSGYVGEHFFLKETVEEHFSMDAETLDTLPDKDALRRIREAAFSRRILKFCLAFVSLSFIALFAFRIGASIYIDRSQSKIQGFKARVQKQKELSQVLEQLESDRAVSESFLKHRSHVATSLKNFVVNVTDNVWITSWNASRGNHSVQGYAITPEDLSEFLSKLEKERNLVNVRLKTTEKTTWNKMQVVRFSLSAEDVR